MHESEDDSPKPRKGRKPVKEIECFDMSDDGDDTDNFGPARERRDLLTKRANRSLRSVDTKRHKTKTTMGYTPRKLYVNPTKIYKPNFRFKRINDDGDDVDDESPRMSITGKVY